VIARATKSRAAISAQWRAALALLTALALGAVACAPARRATPPNIILISIDSLRGDRLGCYGYPRPVSPTLDRLASEGILFEDVMSQSSWTLPAHVSLMTSLYADRHGVRSERAKMRRGQPTLARALREHGYTTGAVVSGPLVTSAFGFDEGFDHFDESVVGDMEGSHRGIVGPRTNGAVRRFLQSAPREPFFLFVHYWDVHYDYAPQPPFAQIFGYREGAARGFANFAKDKTIDASLTEVECAQLAALYDGEIRFTDGMIEELLVSLDAAGLLERSLVIVTSDHGDEFFEHGGKGHQNTVYDEVVKIPLIVWAADGRWGQRLVSEPVELIDVLPTVLAAAGVAADTTRIDGRDLLARLGAPSDRRVPVAARPRFTETEINTRSESGGRARVRLAAVESQKKKLIVTSGGLDRRQLFDLDADPRELLDLSETDLTAADSLFRTWALRARAHRPQAGQPLAAHADTVKLDPATEEQLRSLGYID
jgi:arylsulfatase A-like enzyme